MTRIILIFSVLLIKTGYSPKTLEQNYEKAYFASGCFGVLKEFMKISKE